MASENDQPDTDQQHEQQADQGIPEPRPTDGPTDQDTATPVAGDAPESDAPSGTEPDAAAPPVKKATRKRAARKATAPAAAPEPHTETPETPESPETPETLETLETAVESVPEAPPAKRARAKKTAKTAKTAKKAAQPENAPPAEADQPAADADAPTEVAPAETSPRRRAAAAKTAKRGSRRRAADTPDPAADTTPEAAAQAASVVDEEALRFDALETPPGESTGTEPTTAGEEPEAPASGLGAVFQAPAPVAAQPEEEPEEADEAEAQPSEAPRRRRRRGGKGRRSRSSTGAGAAEDETDAEGGRPADSKGGDADNPAKGGGKTDKGQPDDEAAESATSRRRTRRRRRSGSSDADSDEPGVTTKVRESRRDEVTALKGSTRLEAKKQRRREGREAGRRRTVITEAEFLARRESVERVMVVRRLGERTQIGVLEDGVLVEHYISKETNVSMAGNIYLGRVQNVLPSMEAAFVDIGKGRNAVLYAGEVNWDAAGLESGQPKRIENALSSGQSVLVQVTKDPIGHKGARLTSQISLPGRYLVYVPNSAMTGISRKLPDTERSRLKRILKEVVPDTAGVIVRTAAEGASEEELRADVERLTQAWEDISAKAEASSGSGSGKKKGKGGGNAPQLLHGEPDLTVRVIRDIFNEDFASLVVAGDEAWQEVSEYVTSVAPDLSERVTKWTSEEDLFTHYRVDEQIAKAMDRKVWLPSGGSLVIDRTEAMTVVDVNTGKFIGSGGNLEETVTKNNLEAAEEIVRQLRLRDVGGIIVIDFIDMVLESNRDLVVRRLLECLGRDRTKHQVAEVTSLGLVQMTRKRVGSGLIEVFSETCEACGGRGIIIHSDPVDKSGNGSGGHDHGDNGSGASRGSNARGKSRSSRPEPPAPPRPSGPTPAQIAAAAHAAAVKNLEYAEDLPVGEHQDVPVELIQEIDAAEIELVLPVSTETGADDTATETGTEPVTEAALDAIVDVLGEVAGEVAGDGASEGPAEPSAAITDGPTSQPETAPEQPEPAPQPEPAAQPEPETGAPAYDTGAPATPPASPNGASAPSTPARPRRHRGRVVAPAGPPRSTAGPDPAEAASS